MYVIILHRLEFVVWMGEVENHGYSLLNFNITFSLMLLQSPNVADFSTVAIIHLVIPVNTEQAWS